MTQEILVEVSARHIHLSQSDLETLFGKDYKLKPLRKLSQADDFAAEEKLDLRVNDKEIKGLRIIGPGRDKSQIEISQSDAVALKINVPLRASGDVEGTPGATLVGSQGSLELKEGLIIAKRHLHANPEEAQSLGLSDGEIISLKIEGERGLVFNQVIVRVSQDYNLALHVDTDEGNAAGITKEGRGIVIKNN
jgi:putative phosphotransacetylase